MRAPTHIRLWFNEHLEPAFSTLSVLHADGRPIAQQAAHVPPGERKLLELALPALPPGMYTVRFQVLSIDGHSIQSSYTFTVKGP